MLPIALSVLLACGLLLAAVCVHLWSGFRGPNLAPVAGIGAWIAAGVLLMGALLVWGGRLPVLESFVRPMGYGGAAGSRPANDLDGGLGHSLGGGDRPQGQGWAESFLESGPGLFACAGTDHSRVGASIHADGVGSEW